MNEKEILTLIKKNIHTDMYLRNTCMQCLVSKAKEGDTKMIFGKPYKLSGGEWKPTSGGSKKEETKKTPSSEEKPKSSKDEPTGKMKGAKGWDGEPRKYSHPVPLSGKETMDALEARHQILHGAEAVQHAGEKDFRVKIDGENLRLSPKQVQAMVDSEQVVVSTNKFGNKVLKPTSGGSKKEKK